MRTPSRHGARSAGEAPARDVELVDGVERVSGVTREHVAEPGREPASGDHPHTSAARLLVEIEHHTDGCLVVRDRRERDRRANRASRQVSVGTGWQRGRNHVHSWKRGVAREIDRLDSVVQRDRDPLRAFDVVRRDEHAIDTRRVEQLARGAHADVAEADEEDRAHALNGSRDLRARATRQLCGERCPCRGGAPRHRRERRWPRRAVRAGRPS